MREGKKPAVYQIGAEVLETLDGKGRMTYSKKRS